MTFISYSVLAIPESVPELDGTVARSRDNLAVVCGEGNRKDVIVMAHKAAGSDTSRQLPEAKSLVPGGR